MWLIIKEIYSVFEQSGTFRMSLASYSIKSCWIRFGGCCGSQKSSTVVGSSFVFSNYWQRTEMK